MNENASRGQRLIVIAMLGFLCGAALGISVNVSKIAKILDRAFPEKGAPK